MRSLVTEIELRWVPWPWVFDHLVRKQRLCRTACEQSEGGASSWCLGREMVVASQVVAFEAWQASTARPPAGIAGILMKRVITNDLTIYQVSWHWVGSPIVRVLW